KGIACVATQNFRSRKRFRVRDDVGKLIQTRGSREFVQRKPVARPIDRNRALKNSAAVAGIRIKALRYECVDEKAAEADAAEDERMVRSEIYGWFGVQLRAPSEHAAKVADDDFAYALCLHRDARCDSGLPLHPRVRCPMRE